MKKFLTLVFICTIIFPVLGCTQGEDNKSLCIAALPRSAVVNSSDTQGSNVKTDDQEEIVYTKNTSLSINISRKFRVENQLILPHQIWYKINAKEYKFIDLPYAASKNDSLPISVKYNDLLYLYVWNLDGNYDFYDEDYDKTYKCDRILLPEGSYEDRNCYFKREDSHWILVME